jgi:hypothetical protein
VANSYDVAAKRCTGYSWPTSGVVAIITAFGWIMSFIAIGHRTRFGRGGARCEGASDHHPVWAMVL